MEPMIEESRKKDGVTRFVKHVREVRVNYRATKLERKTLHNSLEATEYMRKVLPDNSREHFIVLYLDSEHNVVCYAVVFTGTADSCHIHPREVFQLAVMVGAVGIIVSHNHPSGSPEPSQNDKALTRLLNQASDIIGIKLLDHIVITGDSYYSFDEHGEL